MNVAGNPFCSNKDSSDYEKTFIVALSPQIKYLNYEYIDDETRKQYIDQSKNSTAYLTDNQEGDQDENKVAQAKIKRL